MATHPLELVHIDYLCLEPGKGKEKVPVVMDHFTGYAQVYVTQSQIAQTMTKALWDNFIIHYALLGKILSDQGREFTVGPLGFYECDRMPLRLSNTLGTLMAS